MGVDVLIIFVASNDGCFAVVVNAKEECDEKAETAARLPINVQLKAVIRDNVDKLKFNLM